MAGKQRTKKMDNVEIEEQHVAGADSDDCSVDEAESDVDDVEHPHIECVHQYEDHGEAADVLSADADADVEDLGKRKGTNDAREGIVKKFRDTPPNASTSHGGYREVPIQGMKTSGHTGSYKTYRVKKDPYVKEAKETMGKPVAVPLDQYVGMALLAT